MSAGRWLTVAGLLLLARVVDVALLARSPMAELGPDLMLLVVVALALAEGSMVGAAVGVLAGLLADLTPPATGLLGVSALGYGIAGAVAGRWSRRARYSRLAAVPAAAAAAVVLVGVRMLDSALRNGQTSVTGLAASVPTAAVLALLVVPAVLAVDRRVGPEPPEVLRW
jgi:rod shape-determining protein MreD